MLSDSRNILHNQIEIPLLLFPEFGITNLGNSTEFNDCNDVLLSVLWVVIILPIVVYTIGKHTFNV